MPRKSHSSPPIFSTQEAALSEVSRNRWGKHPRCYHCNSKNVRKEKINRDILVYSCKNKSCHVNRFSPFHGTDLKATNIKVNDWLTACVEYNKGENGCTIKALAKRLGFQQPTVSKMYKRLESVNQQGVNLFGKYNPKTPHRRHQKTHKQYDHMKSIGRSSVQTSPCQRLTAQNANHTGKVKRIGGFVKKSGRRKVLLEERAFKKKYNTEEKAINDMILKRWNGKPECPYCNSQRISEDKTQRLLGFRCRNKKCKHDRFNVYTETPFKYNKLPADEVLYARYDILISDNGMAALEFQKRYGHTYRTCLFTMHRVKRDMEMLPGRDVMGYVQEDASEPYGKKKGSKTKKRKTKKTNAQLIGIYSPNDGRTYLRTAWEGCTTKELVGFLTDVCAPNGLKHVMCDTSAANLALKKYTYNVECINHSDNERARESMFDVVFKNYGMNKNIVTTNNLEMLWGIVNGNVVNTHKGVSLAYYILYAGEAAFRLGPGNSKLDIAHRLENLIKNSAKNGHVSRRNMRSHYSRSKP